MENLNKTPILSLKSFPVSYTPCNAVNNVSADIYEGLITLVMG